MWIKINPLRWNKMINGIVVGAVWPGDGCIHAWTWPLGKSEKVYLPDAISVARAQEAVDATVD